MSKSMRRKLKKLEEEKQNKLLQAKSIQLLGKYRIGDGAYSLLHSSGTIGQAQTLKEKRRRAVQLSKAGLEVPDEVSPFKKNSQKDSEETEIIQKFDYVPPVKFKEQENQTRSISLGTESGATTKSPPVMDIGLNVSSPLTKTDEEVGVSLLEDQMDFTSTLRPCQVEQGVNSQGRGVGLMIQEHVNVAPILVHVSRPHEVAEKRKDLPIVMMEQEIMEAINEHSIVILCGETGCGKTTQVPQFLYEAGYGSSDRFDRKGIIGVTQPRRVAVLATAKRVSFELGPRLGKEVGFQVRHDKMIGNSCYIKFMTDGILLREVQSDFLLKRYSVIILDEAHERSLNTDILIGMLSRVTRLRQRLCMEQQEKIQSGVRISQENMVSQLKVVLMSATLRVKDFISNRKLFSDIPPVVEVPVRQFPVTIHFSKKTQEDYIGQAYKKVMSIHKKLPPGGILVFVTGQREVEFLCKKLRKASRCPTEIRSLRQAGDEVAASSEMEMNEISDAYEIGSNSPYHQPDGFNSYEEDDYTREVSSDSSDFETEDEAEDDSEDEDSITCGAPENAGLLLNFLRDVESVSLLKASFDALAGMPRDQHCKDEPSHPVGPAADSSTESTAVSASPLYVLPLYALLPASAQLHVFENVPEGERLVVVATNVAETTLTIPGIKYVVDTGKEKVKNYNYTNGIAAYEVQWISKASAAQRAGRAGRTGPGHCYRLYTSAAYSKDNLFPEFSFPEISKTPADGVVLLMKFMGIDKVANFPFPTPPEVEALVEAERCLKALQALDSQGGLTPLGRAMAQYPMSPRHSRMLLTVIQIMKHQQGYSWSNLVLGYSIAAASALSFSSPLLVQFGEEHGINDQVFQEEKPDAYNLEDQQEKHRQKKIKAMAREALTRFCNPSSDALTIAYALQLFELQITLWNSAKATHFT